MKVVITSIHLRSIWSFFRLADYARRILKDLRREPACLEIKTRGLGKVHYTMTRWNDVEAMKKWYVSGDHLKAMKVAGSIAEKITTCTVESDTFPDWKNAITLLNQQGKAIVYNKQQSNNK